MTLKNIIALMFVLIFVGVAVLIGIHVFKYQEYQSNEKSLEIDMNHYSALVFGYWKTPYYGGGAGQNMAFIKLDKLAEFIGFSHVIEPANKSSYYSVFTLNGEIRLLSVSSNTVVLKGIGRVSRKGNYSMIQNNINLYTFMINNSVGAAPGF
jgi:hypothetical protein